MGRIIKFIFVIVVVVAAAGAISFAGAFMKMKAYLGSDLPPLGPRESGFLTKAEQFGNKMAWEFRYPSTEMQGLQSITVFVSPTGDILGTIPSNLKARLEPYRSQMP